MSAYDSSMEPPDVVDFDESGDVQEHLRLSLSIRVWPTKTGWSWALHFSEYAEKDSCLDGDCDIDTEAEAFGDAQRQRDIYIAQEMEHLEELAREDEP